MRPSRCSSSSTMHHLDLRAFAAQIDGTAWRANGEFRKAEGCYTLELRTFIEMPCSLAKICPRAVG